MGQNGYVLSKRHDIITYRGRTGLFNVLKIFLSVQSNSETMTGHMCFLGLIMTVLLVIGGIEVNLGPQI
jgi:hypothetical protein